MLVLIAADDTDVTVKLLLLESVNVVLPFVPSACKSKDTFEKKASLNADATPISFCHSI